MVRFKVFVVLILIAAVPGLLFAQQAAEAMRLQDLMGMEVMSQDQALRGQIDDFVFSTEGDLSHAVASFQEQGDQRYLIPIDQATLEGEYVTVQVSQADLEQLQTIEGDQLPQEIAADHVLASKIQEFTVVGQDGQEIGRVEGAMINVQDKSLEYVAVAPSGQLGLQEELYAVSRDNIDRIDGEQSQLSLSIGADEFGQTSGFSQDNWPQSADM